MTIYVSSSHSYYLREYDILFLCTFISLSPHSGNAGWGISYYLNGLLVPKVTVFRGTTYTFITEGGSDPSEQSRYHPFYITDSERGGFLQKSQRERDVSIVL